MIPQLSAKPTKFNVEMDLSRGQPWTAEGFGTSFDRHRSKIGLGPKDGGPTIHDMRKTCATHMVILQHQYPALISDQILIDLFGWTEKTLTKMKRIYVSEKAVIEAISEAGPGPEEALNRSTVPLRSTATG